MYSGEISRITFSYLLPSHVLLVPWVGDSLLSLPYSVYGNEDISNSTPFRQLVGGNDRITLQMVILWFWLRVE